MPKTDGLPPYPADCVNNFAVKFCRSEKYLSYSGCTKETMLAIESRINMSLVAFFILTKELSPKNT
jgi:hypothetical protein